MADLAPFPGWRFAHGDPATHAAPPYDVLSDANRQELLARCATNVVAIDLPVAPSATADGHAPPDAYATAARTLAAWINDGVLACDADALYVHRMTWDTDHGQRTTTGVMGALALPTGGGDTTTPTPDAVLPHEHTTPKASTDRLELLRATRANLSPIWVLTPSPQFTTLLALPRPADVAFTADDLVRHEVWVVTDPDTIRPIRAALADYPVVVADGHHRLSTSVRYRDEQVAARAPGPGDDRVLALVTELVPGTVEVHGIHRLVGTWPADNDVVTHLAVNHQLTEVTDADPLAPRLADADAFGVVAGDRRWLATGGRPAGVFDSLHISDIITTAGASDVTYHHDEANVTEQVRCGHAAVGFVLRPPTIDQILQVANGGDRMPPKSTFFAPKPPTGLVLRLLD